MHNISIPNVFIKVVSGTVKNLIATSCMYMRLFHSHTLRAVNNKKFGNRNLIDRNIAIQVMTK